MRAAVVVFPGSNCDADAFYALRDELGVQTDYVWHAETDLRGYDLVVIPGGFSYGDYLRCGAIARFSPVMRAVQAHADRGGFVMGICNGFQILCESGLLPGALVRNEGMKFACKPVYLRVENTQSVFTRGYQPQQVIQIPIAHGEGRYVCDEPTLQQLREENRILFRYCSPEGDSSEDWNPNGSVDFIAGVLNERGNVMGMMPHPERACNRGLGSADGCRLFESALGVLVG